LSTSNHDFFICHAVFPADTTYYASSPSAMNSIQSFAVYINANVKRPQLTISPTHYFTESRTCIPINQSINQLVGRSVSQ